MENARLEKAKERLSLYYEAEMAVLTNQEYRIGSRLLRRADLSEIRQSIKDLEKLVAELESKQAGKGSRRVMRIVPRDL